MNETEKRRGDRAREAFPQGYNCSQSVVIAFADLLEPGEETLLQIASSFGGGMGRMREVCGAVSGMLMILGLKYGYNTPETGTLKAEHDRRVQEVCRRFREKHGSIICRELLGLPEGPDSPEPTPRTAAFYQQRPCAEIIRDAAEIMEQWIREQDYK